VDRNVRREDSAQAEIDIMGAPNRESYDQIESFLSGMPYPIRGVNFVRPVTKFGRRMFRYFDGEFPYSIYYEVDEHEIQVLLVLRSATRRTPM
jgi:hypothetical protein